MLAGSFAGLSKKERLELSLATGRILLKRKLQKQSHSDTKRMLQELWALSVAADTDQEALRKLTNFLQKFVRPNVRMLLAAIEGEELDAVLATSAAGEYSHELGKALGFKQVLTTPLCAETDYVENCKERKRDRVLSALESLGWSNRTRVLLTDHEEDLPLMQICHRTLWFGRYEDIDPLQQRMPDTRIIFARNTSDVEIMRLARYH